ncbi:MAG: HzsA-related protein [Pirellulaceae bacterium]
MKSFAGHRFHLLRLRSAARAHGVLWGLMVFCCCMAIPAALPQVARAAAGEEHVSQDLFPIPLFSGRIAVLPDPTQADLRRSPMGQMLAALGLERHVVFLTPNQLVDPEVFHVQRFSVALYLCGEVYWQTVHAPEDGDAALQRFLADGGRLLVLPSGPLPFCYNERYAPVASAGKFGLRMGAGAFSEPPAGRHLTFDRRVGCDVLSTLPDLLPFPSSGEADQRWRPMNGPTDETARYVPWLSLRDDTGQAYGEGAAAIEFGSGGRLVYVWSSLLSRDDWRSDILLSALRYALADMSPPPARLTGVRTLVPPEPDGVIDERIWQTAPPSNAFVTPGGPLRTAARRTTMSACWDDDHLYLAVDCAGIASDPNADAVRVWLASAGDGSCVRQLTLTADNRLDVRSVVAGSMSAPEDANILALKSAVRRGADGWTAELVVPVKSLPGAHDRLHIGQVPSLQCARLVLDLSHAHAPAADAVPVDLESIWSPAIDPADVDRFGTLLCSANPWSDDFDAYPPSADAGDQWTLLDGSWRIEDGTLVGQDASTDLREFRGAMRGDDSWRDYEFTVRFRVESRGSERRDGPWFGLRCSPEGDGYVLQFGEDTWYLHKIVFGVASRPDQCLAQGAWSCDDQWHMLRLEARGNRINGELNGSPLFDVTDNSHLNLPSRRCGGLVLAPGKSRRAQGTTIVRYDDVVVKPASQVPLPPATASLRASLWQSDQVAAYRAARELGRSGDPAYAPLLAELLPDERLGFWELAAEGIPRLTDIDVRGQRLAVPAPDWMPNLRVAYAAMESLGELGGPVAADTLLRALENDQYLIRYGAARGLARMRCADAVSVLTHLAANDPVLLVRTAARGALAEILGRESPAMSEPTMPAAIAFVKTSNRTESNLGFRDSYFFPKTPWYAWGENLYTLTPPRPDGVLKNLTQLENGLVQGPHVSCDGTSILFAMRPQADRGGFHIYEVHVDGSELRQLTLGNCNDVDPAYLPDGRIIFSSDRAGYQEYYHQERSRALYVMDPNGANLEQVTFNPNQDYEPRVLSDGRVLYSSYRFYAQDGSPGPVRGESYGITRIETVLRVILPDGSGDQLLYGAMRGSFFAPLRPMPFSDQRAGWHRRGYHVGVSVSQAREMPDGRIVCTTPAGLTLLDMTGGPTDCELPLFPEVVNLAGGEEVYIHNYDDQNPVGRFTSPYPLDDEWILVSHAPWNDLRGSGYGLYALHLPTRTMRLVYDDPQLSEVHAVAIAPRTVPPVIASTLRRAAPATGRIYCNSVFNTDLPFEPAQVKYVRVIEGIQMGLSINANAAWRTRELGTTPLHPDGSFYVEVPADVPLRFELLDTDGRILVHETEFNYVRPGETKGCIGCHEPRHTAPGNALPRATAWPPVPALRQAGDLIYMGRPQVPYSTPYRD